MWWTGKAATFVTHHPGRSFRCNSDRLKQRSRPGSETLEIFCKCVPGPNRKHQPGVFANARRNGRTCQLKEVSCITHQDFDLDRERDLERERWEPPFEWAGERAGERLTDFPERRGLTLPDAERDSWTNHIHQQTHLSAPAKWSVQTFAKILLCV